MPREKRNIEEHREILEAIDIPFSMGDLVIRYRQSQ